MSAKRLSLILLGSLLALSACANNDNPIFSNPVDNSNILNNNEGNPLVIEPGAYTLEVGKSTKATALLKQGDDIKRDLPTTWVSLDPAIVSIDAQGNITALKPGNTRIKAQTLSNEATAVVTVTPAGVAVSPDPGASANPSGGLGTVASPDPGSAELAKLRTIVIRPENETVQPTMFKFSRLGETRKFVAEGKDSEGQTIPNLTFSWSSSVEGVSTVNSTGVVTAVATGTSNLIASAGNVTSNIVQLVVQEGTIRAHIRFTE